MSKCIFCETTDNLNTQLSIALDDGSKITVDICEQHAEDATVKTARAAYLTRRKRAEELMAELKALGYAVSDTPTKLIVATAPVPEQKTRTNQAASQVTDEDVSQMIPTEMIDSRTGMVSVGGNTTHGSVSSYNSHDVNLTGMSPEERASVVAARKGKAKLVMVEGRDGVPIAIPEKRVDGMGTTVIKISKKEDDGKLQDRFKKMADDSIRHDRCPDFATAGYKNAQHNCPICNGQCTIVNNKQRILCPKCNGVGSISTY